MFYVRFQQGTHSMPLGTRILVTLGMILFLSLLFFFAFSFFVVALAIGAILFIVRLFLPKPGPSEGMQDYTPPQFKDAPKKPSSNDDVIDI